VDGINLRFVRGQAKLTKNVVPPAAEQGKEPANFFHTAPVSWVEASRKGSTTDFGS